MEIIRRERIAKYIPVLKVLCVIAAVSFTSLLLFKDLYFYSLEEKQETIIYSIPMVFLFFMWIKFRLDEKNGLQVSLVLTDITVVGLAAARILGLFWHSGHVLFILYTMLTTKSKTYRLLCIPFVILTAGFKIYWGDILTPFLGAMIAFALFGFRTHLEKKIVA